MSAEIGDFFWSLAFFFLKKKRSEARVRMIMKVSRIRWVRWVRRVRRVRRVRWVRKNFNHLNLAYSSNLQHTNFAGFSVSAHLSDVRVHFHRKYQGA